MRALLKYRVCVCLPAFHAINGLTRYFFPFLAAFSPSAICLFSFPPSLWHGVYACVCVRVGPVHVSSYLRACLPA